MDKGAYFIYALIVICVSGVLTFMLSLVPGLEPEAQGDIFGIVGTTLVGLIGFLGGLAVNKIKEKIGPEITK